MSKMFILNSVLARATRENQCNIRNAVLRIKKSLRRKVSSMNISPIDVPDELVLNEMTEQKAMLSSVYKAESPILQQELYLLQMLEEKLNGKTNRCS